MRLCHSSAQKMLFSDKPRCQEGKTADSIVQFPPLTIRRFTLSSANPTVRFTICIDPYVWNLVHTEIYKTSGSIIFFFLVSQYHKSLLKNGQNFILNKTSINKRAIFVRYYHYFCKAVCFFLQI